MFLVVGLAAAGLIGIAAAFYFSIRRDRRLRSAGAGRAGTSRRPAGRSDTPRPDLAGHPGRPATGDRPITTFRPAAVGSRNSRAEADTGPDPLPDLGPVLAGPDDSWPVESWPDEPMPGDPTATDPKLGVPGAAASTARPRRRVGFRKGADLDEELWPTETFGGVSDEQFWDDLASDKPLATTARTAQPDAPGKNRLPAGLPGTGQAGTGQAAGPAISPQGSGTYAAAPRPGPDSAAERTAIQPANAATQPVQSMKSQLPAATQPVRAAASTSRPRGAATQPTQPVQPVQPVHLVHPVQPVQPAETRRRPSSAEEDPLTSAAFSLRPSGPVDGRSSLRARNASADRYDTSAPSPYPAPTYGDSSSATQTMATPPYGQDYGYGRGDSAPQAGEPRRRNGTGSHARPDDAGDSARTTRQSRPRHSYPGNGYPGNGSQGSGGYPGSGNYPGHAYQTGSYPVGYPVGGYPGNGHRGNGHGAPYDPRDDYRRLTRQH